MEVAGQWRREWAGTAEYGKVIEGGVTRRVARAMEVMHASGPGSRVRVMRAAYHSTAGPGAPAASFMLHSSRRVISSGSKMLESPTFMTKPLEISSIPLELSPERDLGTENYKVTEPDDLDISEPSKWRSSMNGSSMRVPSEESSSTDNASIIDLDTRMNISKHTNILRKFSFDSDISENPSYTKKSSRASPLLDAPTALSTLKYKSLLTGSKDTWNDRRKSYSFEDTSPLSETIIHSNDTLAMESSTDSGICKSTEIVNEQPDEPPYSQHSNREPQGSFRDWLAKNRTPSFRKENKIKTDKQRYIEEDSVDQIALQSRGRVSIAIPNDERYTNSYTNEDSDRRMKKVEFCKTELHFAADSGTVNIIATDEKPPPSNDFRRRRSAFVPMKGNIDKTITLFGDKQMDVNSKHTDVEYQENRVYSSYEDNSAKKSILKNKIPKPKPYHLGESTVLGQEDANSDNPSPSPTKSKREFIIPTTLTPYSSDNSVPLSVSDKDTYRTTITGSHSHTDRRTNEAVETSITDDKYNEQSKKIRERLRSVPSSPIMETRAKMRPLRENELTYFGVNNSNKKTSERAPKTASITTPDSMFKSVKLIQQVSNSVGNSEAESEDAHDYQNIPLKTNFAPIPTPRNRVNNFTDNNTSDVQTVHTIQPSLESISDIRESRVSRCVRQDTSSKTIKSRSISEPPKYRLGGFEDRPTRRAHQQQISSPSPTKLEKYKSSSKKSPPTQPARKIYESEENEPPLYANIQGLKKETEHIPQPTQRSEQK